MAVETSNQAQITADASTDTNASATEAGKRLPFAYAKRQGVLVTDFEGGRAKVVCRPDVSTPALTELRRFVGAPLQLEIISPEKFNTMLQRSYEYGSSQTMQMIGRAHETTVEGTSIAWSDNASNAITTVDNNF